MYGYHRREASLIPLYTWYELKPQRIDTTGILEPKSRGEKGVSRVSEKASGIV